MLSTDENLQSQILHSQKNGSGYPLVLLHGLFGMGDNLASVDRALAEQFTVYRLDLPNHGRSPWSETMTIGSMAQAVQAFIEQQGLGQVHLLGHSLGGKVAMQLALQQPQLVNRLVVADIAPVAYSGNHDAVFAGINAVDLASLASRRDAEAVLAEYIEEPGVRLFIVKNLYRDQAGKFSWRMNVAGLLSNYENLRAANTGPQAFAGPTLFIKGALSNYIVEDYRAEIMALFPNAQLKIIQDTGHWLHAEKPEQFNRIVKQFLQD